MSLDDKLREIVADKPYPEQAIQDIKSYIAEVIGEDDPPVKADHFQYRSLERFRNQLRAEQRKRAGIE